MPFARPHMLIPILNPDVSLEALEQLLSAEQIRLVMRLDGGTSVHVLATLLNRSLTEITDEIKELAAQGILQLYQRTTPQHRLERVLWPPAIEEWDGLPGVFEESRSNKVDTEPEVYTISSMELPAFHSPPVPSQPSQAETEDPGESTNPEHEPVKLLSIAPDMSMDATIVKGFNLAEFLAAQATIAPSSSSSSPESSSASVPNKDS